MSQIPVEPFAEFVDSLKQAGVAISNEEELRERLAETPHWRFAFATLVAYGQALGIRFKKGCNRINGAAVHRAFVRFHLPESAEATLAASIRAQS
ncbi:MAG: hypothetical protein JNL84_02645 [Candidatus Accumulibacter sp.]|nr:hypothetical protein [Accumulibacter sp.]